MGDKLDRTAINIAVFYFVIALVLQIAQGFDMTESAILNYGVITLDVGDETLPSNLWQQITFAATYLGFFFKNLFFFLQIPEAPAAINLLLNLPRIALVMWIIRLFRGG